MMYLEYHCHVCHNYPMAYLYDLTLHNIAVQCPYCGTVIHLGKQKQKTELNINDVMAEVEMILKRGRSSGGSEEQLI